MLLLHHKRTSPRRFLPALMTANASLVGFGTPVPVGVRAFAAAASTCAATATACACGVGLLGVGVGAGGGTGRGSTGSWCAEAFPENAREAAGRGGDREGGDLVGNSDAGFDRFGWYPSRRAKWVRSPGSNLMMDLARDAVAHRRSSSQKF